MLASLPRLGQVGTDTDDSSWRRFDDFVGAFEGEKFAAVKDVIVEAASS